MADHKIQYQIDAEADGFEETMKRVEELVEGLENPLGKLSDVLALTDSRFVGMAVGIAKAASAMAGISFGTEALLELAKGAAEYSESIQRASEKTGVGVEAIQKLKYSAGLAGVDFDALQHSMEHLSVKIEESKDGMGTAAQAFQALGIGAKSLRDASPDKVLEAIADAFRNAEDGAGKTAVAMELMGREGAALIPLLNKGSEALREQGEEAKRLGAVWSGELTESGARLADQLKVVQLGSEALHRQLGEALAPALAAITAAEVEAMQEGGALRGVMDGLGETLKFATVIVSHLAQGFDELGNMVAIGAQMMAHPGQWAEFGRIGADQLQSIAQKWQRFRDSIDKPLPPLKLEAQEAGPKGKIDFDPNPGDRAKARMQEWDLVLAADKTAYAMQQAAAGTFHEYSLQAEADYWQGIMDKLEAKAPERLDVERRWLSAVQGLREKNMQAFVADLQEQEAHYRTDLDSKLALARQKQSEAAQIYGQDSKAYQETSKLVVQMERAKQEQLYQLAMAGIQAREALESARIDFQERMAQIDVEQGRLSEYGMLRQQQQFEQQRYASRLESWAQEQAALDAKGEKDLAAQQALDERKEAEEQQHQNKMAELSKRLSGAKAMSKISDADVRDVMSGMQQSWASGLQAMLNGTLHFNQAARGLFRGVGSAFEQVIARKSAEFLMSLAIDAARWAAHEAGLTALTVAGEAERTAAKSTAAATGVAVSKTVALDTIMNDAAMAAAGTMASISQIPIIGPFMAPPMAAGAYAMTAGYAGSLIVAEKGGIIPPGVNPLAQLHEQETVLPKAESNWVQKAAKLTLNLDSTIQGSMKQALSRMLPPLDVWNAIPGGMGFRPLGRRYVMSPSFTAGMTATRGVLADAAAAAVGAASSAAPELHFHLESTDPDGAARSIMRNRDAVAQAIAKAYRENSRHLSRSRS